MITRFCAVLVLMAVGTLHAQLMSFQSQSAVAAKPTQNTSAPVPAPASGAATPRLSMTPALQTTGKPVLRVNGVEMTDRDLLREMCVRVPDASQHNGFPK